MSDQIQSVLKEERVFPPPPEFSQAAHISSPAQLDALRREAERDPEAFWAEIAKELHWFTPWQRVLDWNPPFANGSSAAPPTSATTASTGMSPPGAATRRRSSGKASRATAASSPTPTCSARSARFANVLKRPRRRSRRPRRPLHADDSRAGHRHAGLRAHRRDAQRGLRRLQRRGAARPASTTRRPRWSSPPTAATGAAPSCRSRPTSTRRCARRRRSSTCVVVSRTGQTVAMNDGRDLWWHELMDEASDVGACAARRRASAVHPLHQRHDRQAEGRRAHHRRLPGAHVRSPANGSSI